MQLQCVSHQYYDEFHIQVQVYMLNSDDNDVTVFRILKKYRVALTVSSSQDSDHVHVPTVVAQG
jgi:hypothetical protein